MKKKYEKTADIIRPFLVTKDPMVMKVLKRMSKRSDEGLATYKKTMVEAKKPFKTWVSDAQEELWDAILYLEKIKSLK
jgi:hypothetical protein|tara:strand:- start:699 stop:932 length:234 start_codon:yes stop_codon:yes gene_type:complete